MSSFFDIRISVYNGATDNAGVVCPLRAFLFSRRHRADVERVRALYGTEAYKREKKRLPMAAVSGTFRTRTGDGLIAHSGLICIDIDGKDNPSLDMDRDVMPVLASLPYVCYAGKSVGGNGCFAIIPLLHPGLHRQQFCSLKHEFAQRGIVIDKGCGDVTRTRFLSYDEHPYINEDAQLYDAVRTEADEREEAARVARSVVHEPVAAPGGQLTDEQKVELCVRLIEERRVDITEGYANWVSVGASLASLGEKGREFFHRVSRLNSGYKYAQADRKFTNVLATMTRYGIGYFFEVCYRNGITFRDAFRLKNT